MKKIWNGNKTENYANGGVAKLDYAATTWLRKANPKNKNKKSVK